MKYYEIIGDKIRFDCKKFLGLQKILYTKFPNNVNYINNINNYILNIIEEIWEYENADEDDKLGELIDILMYVGSAVNCFTGLDDQHMHVLNNDINFETWILEHEYSDLNKITDLLMSLRRSYPERKWHKPYNKEDIDHKDRSFDTTFTMFRIISIVSAKLINNYSLDEINEELTKKQEFIHNL